jgi:hypothetical protein
MFIVRYLGWYNGWPSSRNYNGWPHPSKIALGLDKYTALLSVDANTLGNVDPTWDRASRIRFIKYYERYDFCAPKKIPGDGVKDFDHAIDKLEHRLAVVVGQPVPSMHDRLTHGRKRPEKFEDTFARMDSKMDRLVASFDMLAGMLGNAATPTSREVKDLRTDRQNHSTDSAAVRTMRTPSPDVDLGDRLADIAKGNGRGGHVIV